MGNLFSDKPVMDLDLLIPSVHRETIELLRVMVCNLRLDCVSQQRGRPVLLNMKGVVVPSKLRKIRVSSQIGTGEWLVSIQKMIYIWKPVL